MSPHGITGPPDQFSRNSGNKTHNTGKFRFPPTESVRDIRREKFLLAEK